MKVHLEQRSKEEQVEYLQRALLEKTAELCAFKQRVKEAIDEIHISHRVSVGDLKLIQKELKERLGL